METLEIIDIIQKAGFVGILIILAFPVLRKKFFNGTNNSELKEIKENHLHSIETKLDTLIEKIDKLVEQNVEILINIRKKR